MLSDFMQKKMLLMFNLLDHDSNGHLELEDFNQAFNKMSELLKLDPASQAHKDLKISFDKRWNLIKRNSDSNEDGKVTKEEWLNYCENILSNEELYLKHISSIAIMIFEIIGKEQKGKLTQEGLSKFYEAYGIDPEIADFVFPNFDLDLDGYIDINELKFLFDQFHRSEEPLDPGNQFFGDLGIV